MKEPLKTTDGVTVMPGMTIWVIDQFRRPFMEGLEKHTVTTVGTDAFETKDSQGCVDRLFEVEEPDGGYWWDKAKAYEQLLNRVRQTAEEAQKQVERIEIEQEEYLSTC